MFLDVVHVEVGELVLRQLEGFARVVVPSRDVSDALLIRLVALLLADAVRKGESLKSK